MKITDPVCGGSGGCAVPVRQMGIAWTGNDPHYVRGKYWYFPEEAYRTDDLPPLLGRDIPFELLCGVETLLILFQVMIAIAIAGRCV